jgi:hydroxymethylbilane synthase
MSENKLILATRNSLLAKTQALWVKEQLLHYHPQLQIELLMLTTAADRLPQTSLSVLPGKGIFVKELETALLANRADLAVHSLKDVPISLAAGLMLPVICEREDPRDVLVSNVYTSITDLANGALVGTASVRRRSQLQALRPDLKISSVRGNVDTRLGYLDRQEFAALILAAAGLKRLGLSKRISYYLPVSTMLPAPGQGALGLECRASDWQTQQYLAPLHHYETAICVTAERALCQQLEANCSVPIAAYATLKDQQLFLTALIASLDGSQLIVASACAAKNDPIGLGVVVAQKLLAKGAGKILQEFS